MLSNAQIDAMVANALQAGGFPPSAVKPLPKAHREFRSKGNGGPAEKHGLSLFGYFEMKKPISQRRIVLVSA